MKLKISLIIMIIFIGLISFGCKKEEIEIVEVEELIVEEEIIEDDVEEIIEKEGIASPLSGIYGPEEKINRRPIAIMFDNHPRARWQAGLKDAEIIYEFSVEAPYTRYMGIFLMNDPEIIGSIRSSRPYFVTTVLEYDALYVRVGGSEQAKSDIRTLKVADIDGLSSSNKVFWRKTHKKMPHNLYSSMEVIRKVQNDRGYEELGDYTAFKFKEDEEDINGELATKVIINYNKNNTTEYDYDSENKVYIRSKDGELHKDEIDEVQITAKNIIVQEAKTRVIDNEGRIEIDLIGEGKGKYITNGKYIDIKWKKQSRNGKTLYYDLDDNEIVFNPGITWIQVVGIDPNVIIE